MRYTRSGDYPFNDLNILVMDWETFWGTKYTLRSTPTSEYVRHEKFKSHGVGVYDVGKDERLWLSGDAEKEYIESVDWGKTALLCHNTYFDGFILHHHYGKHPALYMDTLCMSKANWGGPAVGHKLGEIGERLGLGAKEGSNILNETKNIRDLNPLQLYRMGQYCQHDVYLTWKIFKKLIEEEEFPCSELSVIEYSLRAFCDPRLHINKQLAEEELRDEQRIKQALLDREGITKADIMSDAKFEQLLLSRGLDPYDIPKKWSEKKQCEINAFAKSDQDFTDLLDDPAVGGLVEARLRVKTTIVESRASRLIVHGDPGPLPIYVNYWQALTGRWGGGDKLNPQNFPAGRGGQTMRLRNAIVAPPGYKLVAVDSSQIEARYLAWLSGNEALLDVFRAGKDPYLYTASEVFQEDFDDPEKYSLERQLGKVMVLALGYGMGLKKMIATARIQYGVDLDPAYAAQMHAAYRVRIRDTVAKFWGLMDEMLFFMATVRSDAVKEYKNMVFSAERIWMSNNCPIYYPNLKRTRQGYSYYMRKRWRHLYGGKTTENVTQGECRNVVAEQAIPIALLYYICLLAHDEVVMLVREEEAEEALAFGIKCMSTPPSWAPDLPVAAKGKIGNTYGETK